MMTEFIVGFGGVLIGAVFLFWIEIWRQVLEGRSAAKVVFAELMNNSQVCEEATKKDFSALNVTDEAWRSERIRLIPLLSDEVAAYLMATYSPMFITQQMIDGLEKNEPDAWANAIAMIDMSLSFRRNAQWMNEVSKKNRALQFIELLVGRPSLTAATSPTRQVPHRHGTLTEWHDVPDQVETA